MKNDESELTSRGLAPAPPSLGYVFFDFNQQAVYLHGQCLMFHVLLFLLGHNSKHTTILRVCMHNDPPTEVLELILNRIRHQPAQNWRDQLKYIALVMNETRFEEPVSHYSNCPCFCSLISALLYRLLSSSPDGICFNP